MNETKKILKLIVRKYAITEFDWMHFKITKENPLTFHHIKKKAEGGEVTLENGAPLTKYAQEYLHLIENYDFRIYRRLNYVFNDINKHGLPINPRQERRIELLLLEFEERRYEVLRKRQGIGTFDDFNATLERKRCQEGEPPKVKKKKRRKKKN